MSLDIGQWAKRYIEAAGVSLGRVVQRLFSTYSKDSMFISSHVYLCVQKYFCYSLWLKVLMLSVLI